MIFASRVFIKTLYNAFPIVGVNGKVKLIPVFRGDIVAHKIDIYDPVSTYSVLTGFLFI